MLTAAGTGYVHLGPAAVTRWKPDLTSDSLGYFFYLRDLESNEFWSLGYQPTCVEPERYEYWQSPGTATIERSRSRDSSRMEVCVHEELDVELRRVTLTNNGPAATFDRDYKLRRTSPAKCRGGQFPPGIFQVIC